MYNKLTISYRKAFCLTLAFLLLSQSAMFRELTSARIRAALMIAIVAIVYIMEKVKSNRTKLRICRNHIYLLALLMFCIGISSIFNGFNVIYDLFTVIMLCIAVAVVSIMEFKVFIYAYINSMVFLSSASLLIYIGYKVAPFLFLGFPDHNWHGGVLKNCILGVVQVGSQNYRNFGIFVEPGMYCVFLIYALFFSLFIVDINVKKVIILFATLASTLSTAGYISGILLFICFFLQRRSIPRKIRCWLGICFLFIIIAVVGFLISNKGVYNYLTSKLYEISFSSNVNATASGSGYERWRAIVYAVDAFFESPLWGIGRNGWNIKFDSIIATATPINWFGLYGILYGLCLNFLYIKNAFIISSKKPLSIISAFLLIVILVWNIFSQNMENDITVFLLIFYQALTCNTHWQGKLKKRTKNEAN